MRIHSLARDLTECENLLTSMPASGENWEHTPSLKMQEIAQLKNMLWKKPETTAIKCWLNATDSDISVL